MPLCDRSRYMSLFFKGAFPGFCRRASGSALWIALVALVSVTAAFAQSNSSPSASSPPTSVTQSAPAPAAPTVNLFPTEAPPEYKVGAGDVLGITVFNMPELDRTAVLGSDGALQLSYFQRPLMVKGDTTQQIEEKLRAALKRSQILIYPQLEVSVIKVESKPVMVGGDVRNPQILQEIRPMTLVEALMLAGGPKGNASNSVLVTRVNSSGQPVSYDLPLSKVLAGTNKTDNMAVHPGDTIQILPGEKVFVAGDVKNPGAFSLQRDQQLTVAKIMALSGGWKSNARPKKAVIVREEPDGKRVTIPVDLPKIMDEKKSDIALESNDLLYVPGSVAKTVGLAVVKGVGGAAMLGLGYLIIRQ